MIISNGADSIQLLETEITKVESIIHTKLKCLIALTPDRLDEAIYFKKEIDELVLKIINFKTDIEYIKRGWK